MFQSSVKDQAFIISITESVYPDNSAEIIGCFNDAMSSGKSLIILDLSKVEVIYSSGITNLVQLFTQLKARQAELIIVGIQDGVLKIFKLLGLHQLFKFSATLEDALASGSKK